MLAKLRMHARRARTNGLTQQNAEDLVSVHVRNEVALNRWSKSHGRCVLLWAQKTIEDIFHERGS